MKPFNNLKSPPFYAILFATAREGVDAGLYSEAIATLVSAATMRSGFLGFSSDVDANGNPVKISYWETHKALQDWLAATQDLLPFRIKLDDCLGPSGCLWPWQNRLDETDVMLKIGTA